MSENEKTPEVPVEEKKEETTEEPKKKSRWTRFFRDPYVHVE